MLNTEFIPTTLAVKLKETLDFREPSFAIDMKDGSYLTSGGIVLFTNGHRYYQDCAITYHQAYRWFRERFELFGSLSCAGEKDFYYSITNKQGKLLIVSTFYLPTYEEAEVLCLSDMIEIARKSIESKQEVKEQELQIINN